MSHLAIQQRRQAVAAGQAVKKFVRSQRLLAVARSAPTREVWQRAAPHHLLFLVFHLTQSVFVQRVSIRAPEQGAPARTLPLAVFLFHFPRFELAASPAKI